MIVRTDNIRSAIVGQTIVNSNKLILESNLYQILKEKNGKDDCDL